MDWTELSFAVEGEGAHELTWAYVKDESGSVYDDCAWGDAVTWTPNAAEVGEAGDAVVAPKQTGAQGFYKVWVSDAPIGSVRVN